MLHWRLLLGTLIIAALVGLCWLDHLAAVPGIWLMPVAIVLVVMASGEMLRLAEAAGLCPLAPAVYGGNLLLIVSNWMFAFCGMLFALAIGAMAILMGEIRRYEKPGGVTADMAAAVFALVYVGVMFGFVVQLRMSWGIAALASLLIVVKLGDIGAYTVGRLFGRHQIAPVLSPGKTVEGAIGALTFACFGSWVTFRWLVPWLAGEGAAAGPWWGWTAFGLLVGTAGLLGDLAESLIKRDVGWKDSSSWLPGFGGVLDILDSILLAAPVAWCCWALGLVGS